MNLVNLDQMTRRYMLQEVDVDVRVGRLYFSRRLTQNGQAEYEALLRDAIEQYDAHWLAAPLKAGGRMDSPELSRSGGGAPIVKRTPFGDHETLAFGEFNRFYIRGLCARAVAEGIGH